MYRLDASPCIFFVESVSYINLREVGVGLILSTFSNNHSSLMYDAHFSTFCACTALSIALTPFVHMVLFWQSNFLMASCFSLHIMAEFRIPQFFMSRIVCMGFILLQCIFVESVS
jgi:hypothetical protein